MILLSAAALAVLFPWRDALYRYQIRRNSRDLSRALKMVSTMEKDIEQPVESGPLINDYYTTGRIWGLMGVQSVGADAFDRMHQKYRRSLNLGPFTLKKDSKILCRYRIIESYSQIASAIIEQKRITVPRDLRYLSLYLIGLGVLAGILAHFV